MVTEKRTIRIAFYDTKPYDRDFFTKTASLPQFDTVSILFDFYEGHLTAATASLAKGHDAVCVFVNDQITPEVADLLYDEGIRILALRCAGYNNVDLKSVFRRIHVVRVPAYSPHAVAEYAVALLQTLNRKINHAYNRTRDGNFVLNGLVGNDLYGKTAGIIGAGKIGRITAEIFAGYGMKILLNDRYTDQEFAAKTGARYVNLEELFSQSDYISLHCPLTPENRHIVNDKSIALMKRDAVIINTGRGALVDTQALLSGLISGHIRGAALDVYEEEEQYFFEDWSQAPIQDANLARLIQLPNVILTAHQAFLTADALDQIAMVTISNIKNYLIDDKIENEICYQCAEHVTPESCMQKTTGSCWR
jgi:D-lactate dehydrogenase